MRFLNSSRLRAIKSFFLFVALYFALGINAQSSLIDSEHSVFGSYFSIFLSQGHSRENLFAEFEEGEGEILYFEPVYIANLVSLILRVSKISIFEFLFYSYTIQNHLLNLPPPIS
jgi:hypothetical protein